MLQCRKLPPCSIELLLQLIQLAKSLLVLLNWHHCTRGCPLLGCPQLCLHTLQRRLALLQLAAHCFGLLLCPGPSSLGRHKRCGLVLRVEGGTWRNA